MATRQSHRKARTGCSNCKKRHVKCDERGPPCANCRVREIACDFVPIAVNGRKNASPKPELKSQPDAGVGSRSLEFELLHRWSVETCLAMAFNKEEEHAWQFLVPKLAIRHDYLLNAMFAITSLHTAISVPPCDALAYHRFTLEYQNRAIAAFRAQTEPLTEQSHQPIFAFSIINLALSLALPYHSPRDVSQSSVKKNLVTVFQLLQGSISIFSNSRDWLQAGPFRTLVDFPMKEHLEDLEVATLDAMQQLRTLVDYSYDVSMGSAELPLDALRLYESCTHAVSKLESCFSLYQTEGSISCFRWLGNLDSTFLQALEASEPVVTLITMHWAVLLDRVGRERWWARSAGKLLAAELSREIISCRPQWHPMVSWIHQQVGLPAVKQQYPEALLGEIVV